MYRDPPRYVGHGATEALYWRQDHALPEVRGSGVIVSGDHRHSNSAAVAVDGSAIHCGCPQGTNFLIAPGTIPQLSAIKAKIAPVVALEPEQHAQAAKKKKREITLTIGVFFDGNLSLWQLVTPTDEIFRAICVGAMASVLPAWRAIIMLVFTDLRRTPELAEVAEWPGLIDGQPFLIGEDGVFNRDVIAEKYIPCPANWNAIIVHTDGLIHGGASPSALTGFINRPDGHMQPAEMKPG